MPTAKRKHKSRPQWLQRHLTDPYVKAATAAGYRSRAAYKLAEIDRAERLLRPGMTVVDLGAAPGSWTQVVRERLTQGGSVRGRIVALDLLPVAALPDVTVLQGDFRDEAVAAELDRVLAGAPVDVVLSDLAPNLSGIPAADAARSAHLGELALEFARRHLRPGGVLVVKAFHGSGYSQFVAALKQVFVRVTVRKPPASRAESAETYLVARGLKASQPAVAEAGPDPPP